MWNRVGVTALGVVAVTMAWFVGSSEAGVVNQSKFRQIKNGVGNCIFATHVLSFGSDAYSGVKAEFAEGDWVHARCYYPDQRKGYEDRGKLHNSLRGEKSWFVELTVKIPNNGDVFRHIAPFDYDADARGDDQQRLDLIPSDASLCDFKKGQACLDIAGVVRRLASDKKVSLPVTADVCLFNYIQVADTARQQWEASQNAWVQKFNLTNVVLAEGCFKYTVK